MQELREAIEQYGQGLGTDIVKVDMFLNHRIDTGLLFRMGETLAEAFREDAPTLVMTVEASGIALAAATAHALGDIPMVFAKKGATVVQGSEMVLARIYSFTHKQDYSVRVERRYLPEGSRVLIIDDFLADGQATQGMLSLCEQAGCVAVGVGIAVEKGFMPGGKRLRDAGVKLKSLAVVSGIEDGKIIMADD